MLDAIRPKSFTRLSSFRHEGEGYVAASRRYRFRHPPPRRYKIKEVCYYYYYYCCWGERGSGAGRRRRAGGGRLTVCREPVESGRRSP